jgi:F-type H+-transporting ATPase subunit epsilon
MNQKLDLSIVTPFGQIFSGEVNGCVAPGENGQFQILRGHTDFLSIINIGLIKIDKISEKTLYLATSGGFCEVNDGNIKIIVESAESLETIDVQRAEEAKKRAEERLSSQKKGTDFIRAELALRRAVNRLKISQLS